MTTTPAGRQWEGARRQRRALWLLLAVLAVLAVGVTARLASVSGGGRLEVGRDGSTGDGAGPGTQGAVGGEAGAAMWSEVRVAPGTWIGVPDPPVAWVRPPSMVWTGKVVLVWGATIDGAAGAAFDRSTRTWRMLPDAPIGARDGQVAVWTGGTSDPEAPGEMIVWGGRPLFESPREAPGGAAYDPASDRWRLIAEAPFPIRSGAHAAWTGTHLLVAPGPRAAGQPAGSPGSAAEPAPAEPAADATPQPAAAAYDPVTDTWQALPALPPGTWLDGLTWTGTETLALLGQPGRQELVPAAAWDTELGLWLPRPAAPVGVAASVAAVTTYSGPVLWVRSPDGAARLVLFDRDGHRWTVTGRAPLGDRTAPSLVSTGRRIIVWGGTDVRGRLGDGALYDTVQERWLRIDGASQPVSRPLAAVWAGGEMVVVGYRGRDRQDVAAAGWAPVPATPSPRAP